MSQCGNQLDNASLLSQQVSEFASAERRGPILDEITDGNSPLLSSVRSMARGIPFSEREGGRERDESLCFPLNGALAVKWTSRESYLRLLYQSL